MVSIPERVKAQSFCQRRHFEVKLRALSLVNFFGEMAILLNEYSEEQIHDWKASVPH
jgi:hypothetical protein